MLTHDGVRLDADIYRPEEPGEFPVLLMRQPYGKTIASTVVYAHPSWYAEQGYIVVIQDVRGRGNSQGEFQLFSTEIADGEDSINWAANLPGSSGNVGMYGFSYQGMTQLYAASNRPTALKTICPAMIGYDLYADWAYEGGAFCLQANLGWAIQLATETARLKGDEKAYLALYQASRNLPFFDSIPADSEILKQFAPDSFYHDWIKHNQPDSYWKNLSPNLDNVDLPMLHIGGWFDTYLRGTLNFYHEITNRSQHPQHLIIGPWAHLPWGRKVGAIDYGIEAYNPIDELQIRWFDYFLKGIDTEILEESPIALFEMGSNQWREFDSWPSENDRSYFLMSTGLASIREDAGVLMEAVEENSTQIYENLSVSDSLELEEISEFDLEEQEITQSEAFDIIVHDPWRPVPALGGHATFPAGAFERSALDCRSDILTYTSAPLKADLHLAGDVFVEVYCEADTPSFDLCAVLSEVRTDGGVYNFTQGYIRVESSENPIRIQLQATCIKIPQSHAIRLSLSGACFPAYPVNPGTGQPPSQTRLIDAKIITLTLRCGGNFPSKVVLPVVK
ncbi:MAG: CocE/NonD family hydrolase [Lyngbya sp.]|nr:CocE/NonD family hydrolase [Lyngbya sp.]